MISTSYPHGCETFRFAWRNAGFVWLVLGVAAARNEMVLFASDPALTRGSHHSSGLRRGRPAHLAPQETPPKAASLEGRRRLPLADAKAGLRGRFVGASERGLWCATQEAQKVAQGSSQAIGIVRARNFVRAPVRAVTGRSWRSVRPRPAPGRLRARGRPSRSARAPRGLRPSPVVRPARASGRH